MKDLITEARELCEKATPGPWMGLRAAYEDCLLIKCDKDEYLMSQHDVAFVARSRTIIPELCDALEKANEQNKQLMQEVCKLACESLERDKALAKLEAEVGVAIGKGCDYCGLIYAIHTESYGIEDLDCANEPIDNKFCPMCGKRLEVGHI